MSELPAPAPEFEPVVFSERQQGLFEQFPEQPMLVEKLKEFLHTGKVALKDKERCEQILRAVVCEVPARAICRKFHVGYETVQALIKEAEASGKLRTLKERMADDARELQAIALWRLREKLLNDEVPANVLPALYGIATDKVQILTGLPTGIVELKGATTEADVLADLALMKRAKRPDPAALPLPPDSQSSGTGSIPQ